MPTGHYRRQPVSIETRQKISLKLLGNKNGLGSKGLVGLVQSENHKRNISNGLRKAYEEKRRLPSRGRLGKKNSEAIRHKISVATKGKHYPKKSERQRGEKNHQWKGGVTPVYRVIRNSIEYKLWRKAVYERDNYTCVFCGSRGGKLNADHIKRFSLYPELRFAIDNGRTLCERCHKTTENYGNKKTAI